MFLCLLSAVFLPDSLFSVLPPSCETIICQNGGTCVEDPGGAKCNCASGSTGVYCETVTGVSKKWSPDFH